MLLPERAVDALRKVAKTGPIELRAWWRTRPLAPRTVLYESFAGNGALDNPEAIFRALLAAPDLQDLRHVWALSEPDRSQAIVREFAADPRVTFVRRRSPGYVRVLNTAGYLVNNATFPADFGKRPGQVYLNTWHGTPLKHMGYDEPGGAIASRNVLRNFVSADYLLSSGQFMTEQMYESAYRLRNVFSGEVIEEGLPRTDRQFLTDAARSELRERLRASGVALPDGDRVVLYAPTWRGESFHAPNNDALILHDRVRALRARLPEGYAVLLKVHQQAHHFAAEHPGLRDVLVPNDVSTNAALGLTDVLVTDYSSVFFDFLATGRPIVFFAPDLRAYQRSRGFYLAPQDWPGPVTSTVDDLARVVSSVGTGEATDPLVSHAAAYRSAAERFAAHEDGHVADRVIDVVFRGRREGRRVGPFARDGRPTLLIYVGGMRPNGITASALNLLDNIDHRRFDVSVAYLHSGDPDRLRNARLVNPAVRSFPRVGLFIPGKRGRLSRLRLLAQGVDAPGLDLAGVSATFRDEWRRCFGDCRFDHYIDFSGYGPHWAFLGLQGDVGSRSIWLHNDIRADQLREVDGSLPNEANLRSVISMYHRYDHLVSVSPVLDRINGDKLAGAADREKFTWARNTVNHERIRRLAFGSGPGGGTDRSVIQVPRGDLPGAVGTLLDAYGIGPVEGELERRRAVQGVVAPQPDLRTFVTVGRLSPEKNHERLIHAFDAVHQEHSDTRLVVVGSGPLRSSLQKLVRSLGLAEAVTLAGHQDNPFAIMAACDCFVLSSDYEGQPMVALEARVVGLPVISTDFESVAGVLDDGVGLVVPRSVDGLAQGMKQFLRGGVPNPPFDPVSYNEEAIHEFYRAIGVG